MFMPSPQYSGIFDIWKRRSPRFSLKTPGLRFSLYEPKRRLLEAMKQMPMVTS